MSEIVGVTSGCFDLFHSGHRHLLGKCQARCARLVVMVNSDESVRRLKGADRPVNTEVIRYKDVLGCLRARDEVMLFDTEEELETVIIAIQPTFIFKGDEYRDRVVTGNGIARVSFIPMLPGYSTTNEIAKRDRLA